MGRRMLNDASRTIVNAERRGKATANLKPASTVMASSLKIMKERVGMTPNGILDHEEAKTEHGRSSPWLFSLTPSDGRHLATIDLSSGTYNVIVNSSRQLPSSCSFDCIVF